MANDGLTLSVTLLAEDWEAHRRRVRFLEAALVQSMGEGNRLRQWFTVSALASMRLPGLPTSRHGITQRAMREDWRRRIVTGRGGEQYEFHYVALPRPAFDEIVRRVLELPAEPIAKPETFPLPVDRTEAQPAAATAPAPIAPVWLLPLMRVVRSTGSTDARAIARKLPAFLPEGVPAPSLAEVSEAMRAYRGRAPA